LDTKCEQLFLKTQYPALGPTNPEDQSHRPLARGIYIWTNPQKLEAGWFERGRL